jgi:uncharacterized membrane protein YtjA (UPF0391 family)
LCKVVSAEKSICAGRYGSPVGDAISGWRKIEVIMLRWTLIFLVISLVAALLGFGGLAASAAGIARILFFIFLVFFLVSLVWGFTGGGRPRLPPSV